MSSSMTMEVLGSRPELGSSQNRYLGLSAMARAMAARFCMPPEISPGNLSSAPARLTRSRQSMARFVRSRSVIVGEHVEREHHVLQDRHRVEERRRLEDHAHLAVDEGLLLLGHGHEVAPVVEHLSAGGLKQAHEVFHQHRLARARLSDDEVGLAVLKHGADVLQHVLVVEALI